MASSRDYLVILDPAESEAATDELRRRARVSDVASDRVLVVVTDREAEVDALADIPGVLAISTGEVPRGLIESLEETEALFVEAWIHKKMELPGKDRPGEDLDWDATGYAAPDPD